MPKGFVLTDAEPAPAPASTPLLGRKTCNGCEFGETVRDDLKIVECHGVPPTPAIMGMGPGGPAVGLLRARLPREEKACALWKARLTA